MNGNKNNCYAMVIDCVLLVFLQNNGIVK